MKTTITTTLFKSFEDLRHERDGVEYWYARELQTLLKYTEWRNFTNAIDKAKQACKGVGQLVADQFVDVNKLIEHGKGGQRAITDIALTRYACYLIAQNGDPGKTEIAFAQTYFALQTRKQQLIEERLLEVDRLTARPKLTKSEKALSKVIFDRGVNEKSFANIRSMGAAALFGGYTTSGMKDKLGVPAKRPFADFLPTLLIKGKDFATELTSHNVVENDLHGDSAIGREHIDNNAAVRGMLLKRGVTPEELPAAEDVKKIKRRHDNELKKLNKGPTKPTQLGGESD
ncbi:DNA damage-inducible protein D [Neolewinella lacunae]|uniref:DNA damage-inducible protein D n=1 Tax=Neolewinella lacunae TaxID=1517758 RepID=A0A923PJ53_9BACT|nr:DNA damage-inducible protein D [Neolewinella lacunae]MBC6994274.1 DNA damage-inducible protein D [Neolewinella lacunae]MDN3635348.1 DNA damage-inducible protein D [Neolewinella lacunae]